VGADAPEAPPFVSAFLAFAYGAAGDRASAIDNLEQALAADSQMMAWLGQDRIFDPLRSEPRFVALVKKLRLNR